MFNKHKTLSTLKFLSYGTAFSFLSFLSFNALFPAVPSNAATSATATADLELEIEPTIEVAVDTENLNLTYNNETDILPTSEGVTATGDINVYVTTNGLSGYTLSLYTQNATNEMKNINSAVSTSISATDGGVSDLAGNTWGFKYGSSSDWEAVSDDVTNPSVLVSSGTSNSSLCNGLGNLNGNTEALEQCVTNGSASKATVTFGANITDTLPAGRYTNDVVFSAIAKAPSAQHHYAINYNKNNAEATGSTANTSALYPGTASALSDGTGLTLEGMRVAGWAFTEGATEVAEVGSSNTPLTAGATNIETSDLITAAQAAGQDVSEDKSGKITLYAIWEVAARYMQSFSCATDLADGESDTLVDSRDGNEYTVKKFGTGASAECWMTSNLTLGYDQANNVAKGYTLTKDDTNIPDSTTYYIPPAGKAGSVTNSDTVTSAITASFSNDGYDNYAKVQYRAAGQVGDADSTGTLFQNTSYYNYSAATLGYSYYNDGLSSGNAPRDICPAGWQLPRGSSTSTYSFYWLDRALGGTGANRTDTTTRDKFLNDASFGYSGYYGGSQLYYVGSDGYWWSSTLDSSTNASYMYLNSGGRVYPQVNYSKYLGFSIRCVAK